VACRDRFRELLKDTAKYQNAERRKAEFDTRMQEKAAKKMKKKGQDDPEQMDADMHGPDVPERSGSSGLTPAERAEGIAQQERGGEKRQHDEVKDGDWEDFARMLKKKSLDRREHDVEPESKDGDVRPEEVVNDGAEVEEMKIGKVRKKWADIADEEADDGPWGGPSVAALETMDERKVP
jgi:hypothetical protein